MNIHEFDVTDIGMSLVNGEQELVYGCLEIGKITVFFHFVSDLVRDTKEMISCNMTNIYALFVL